jgi:uncharacterized membrane protein HdeD (DUF308 family)
LFAKYKKIMGTKIINSSINTYSQAGTITIGIGQILLGVLIIFIAMLTTWLSVRVLGLILLIWGVIDFFQGLNNNKNRFIWWRRSSGILFFGAGLLLLLFPGMGSAALSLILAVLFVLGGLYKIAAVAGKREPGWGGVMVGGGLSIILGLFIISRWPIKSFLLIGILVGIEIILNGWTLMAAGYVTNRVKHRYTDHVVGD